MKRVVNLWGHAGTGLIIKCATGIAYTNQSCGHHCLHPEQEGAFVPVGNDVALPSRELISKEYELTAYFEGAPWHGSGAATGLTEADADFIDRILADRPDLRQIRVDRSRLTESHEAWVHVLVNEEEGPMVGSIGADMTHVLQRLTTISGFGPFPLEAILTWNNSD
jgi:hypothetical protein